MQHNENDENIENTDDNTVLIPVYIGLNQRAILNWMRDNSTMTRANGLQRGRILARVIVGDFYRERKSNGVTFDGLGYAYPSIPALEELTHFGRTYLKHAVRDLKQSAEWVIVSGYGGRAKATNAASRYYPIIPWQDLPPSVRVEWVTVKVRYAVDLPSWCTPEGYEAAILGPREPQEAPVPVVAAPVPTPVETPVEAPTPAPVPTPAVSLPPALEAALTDDERAEMQSADAAQLQAITERVAALEREGSSLTETLRSARERQRGPRASMPIWLTIYGLRYGKRATASAAPATSSLYGGLTDPNDPDYQTWRSSYHPPVSEEEEPEEEEKGMF